MFVQSLATPTLFTTNKYIVPPSTQNTIHIPWVYYDRAKLAGFGKFHHIFSLSIILPAIIKPPESTYYESLPGKRVGFVDIPLYFPRPRILPVII